MTVITEQRSAADWVAMFAEGWANPVDADTFGDHFEPPRNRRGKIIEVDDSLCHTTLLCHRRLCLGKE